ncbi:DUF2946 domain-containing protein [Yersinia hibernica]|uniref:DUF2946 domain-containing protein n=1 Tax=Yersinia enterocolitica LC20 TaxID=1443113 RepID=A0A7U5STL2_YEREN|nr:DUF2946 domain-containing protein [Yersinia hibernica]ATX62681.1 DUF2946 domain-containing protein [Yersinia hibernica]
MPVGQMLYRRRCYCAWLGIAAILMLFIAPVISTSLVPSSAPSTLSMMVTDDVMDMAHHDVQAAHTGQPAAHHDMVMEHAACGYCVLLTHLPLLNTAFKADMHSVLPRVEISPTIFIYAKIIDDTYSEGHPRAPPLPLFYS